ncbi:MAG TPA: hypothetical protein VHC69_02830, partial [Polyangiaceae bacterium]|nr:hypothetical protein [Polyangiaceae bacterium]
MASRPLVPSAARGLFPGLTPANPGASPTIQVGANGVIQVRSGSTFDETFDETFTGLPIWVVPAIVTVYEKVPDGDVIKWIAPAWRAMLAELIRDPSLRYQLHWRKVEEAVAAGYDAAGFH